jgi:hypothetical protein
MNKDIQNQSLLKRGFKMNFTFTVAELEGNQIIDALASRPFKEVAGLVGKLQAQYSQQVSERNAKQHVSTVENHTTKIEGESI